MLQDLVPVQTNKPSQEIKSNNPSFPGVQDKPFQLDLPIDTVENNSTANTLHSRKEEKKTVILPTTRVTRSAKQVALAPESESDSDNENKKVHFQE